MGTPKNGRFIMENPINIDDLGVPLFQETTIWVVIGCYYVANCKLFDDVNWVWITLALVFFCMRRRFRFGTNQEVTLCSIVQKWERRFVQRCFQCVESICNSLPLVYPYPVLRNPYSKSMRDYIDGWMLTNAAMSCSQFKSSPIVSWF